MSRIAPTLPIRQRIRWNIPAVVAAVVLGAFGTSLADAKLAVLTGNERSRTDANLLGLAAKHPGRHVDVIVQFKDNVSQRRARADVRAFRGRPGLSLPIVHGLSARIRAADAVRLVKRPAVRAVTLNGPVTSQATTGITPTASTLKTFFDLSVAADRTWSKATGKGVGVAVIDTGIAGDLPDFRTDSRDATSRVIASVVTNPRATSAADKYGHGTHVAGIIAGNSNARGSRDPLFGRYAGVAPEANLISIKASDDNGDASVIDVLWGIQFALQHKTDMNIRVLNLSLQSSTPISYRYDPLDAAVEIAWMQGITVVAAAGNLGSDADAVQYAPGNDPFVITVGGLDETATKTVSNDTVAPWSGRGITQDGFAKPEVYAPGAHIVSELAPNSTFATLCPSCITDGAYIRASGTSMAAPVVSGAVAVMLQLHPDWTPDQVKGAIIATLQTGTRDKVGELDVNRASGANGSNLANLGVTPNRLASWFNELINRYGWNPSDSTESTDGTVDLARSSWSRSSWSRSSWSQASGDLAASFARSSWSCTCADIDTSDIDPTRSSWSSKSWSNILER